MNHALPDDPAGWPANPYELLGVAPGVTAQNLRRAYTRLIRAYKPEQYPEQFRRIREAYDSLREFVEMFSFSEQPAPVAPEAAAPTEPAHGDPPGEIHEPRPVSEDTGPDGFRAPPPAPVDDLDQQLDELWQEAAAGQELLAYRRLVDLADRCSTRVDIYQRLYWLLSLSPELDSQRVAADWLVQGMLSSGDGGPLRERYRQQLVGDPGEAYSSRYDRLLNDSPAPGTLADLVDWRFEAGCKLHNWEKLADDIHWLGERIRREDDALWLRLLFSLVHALAWRDEIAAERIFESCVEEIRRHDYLYTKVPYAFDRFDLLNSVRQGWRVLFSRTMVPAVFLNIIPKAWNLGLDGVYPAFLHLLEVLAADRHAWIAYFDRVQQVAPSVLAFFGQLLDQLEADDDHPLEGPLDLEGRVVSVQDFMGRMDKMDYPRWRPQFLDWCLREAISPEDAAEAALQFATRPTGESSLFRSNDWSAPAAVFAEAAGHDWPLRYLYKACQLFWE